MKETETNNLGLPITRNYRDRIFRMLFNDRKALLTLYNAVNRTDYTNPDELEVNTLENAIYMGMKNDISFLLDCRLSLYEQQSSVNLNMPLRNLFYVAKLFQTLVSERNFYGTKRIQLPTPKFVVFYNGTAAQPERQILKLSDAYEVKDDDIELELKTTVLNINAGFNSEIFKRCPLLREYMQYVDCVRKYSEDFPLQKAVELAIRECISNNILTDFLKKNRAEVMEMCLFEYDEELHEKMTRQEAYEDGREAGREEGQLEGRIFTLYELGYTVPEISEKLKQDEEIVAKILNIRGKAVPENCE